jgi:threonine dehydratase
MTITHPSLEAIEATATRIAPYIAHTPTLPYYGSEGLARLNNNADVYLKMELLQKTGSFKARGALNVIMQLTEQDKQQGVTAFSAGNHAIATAFAARTLGTSAKVVMPKTANPFRVETCKKLGAEVIFGADIGELTQIVDDLHRNEGRTIVHPFEGQHTFAGTATVGLELSQHARNLDAVIVPVGGGGLIAGIATAIKLTQPDCQVIGVEPEGACGMSDSLAQKAPLEKVVVNTIADSLGAPLHLPQSFAIVQHFVDEIVRVSDAQLADVMQLMFTDLKLAVEPACAAAMAALMYPLNEKLTNKKVALILCGTNIDHATFQRYTSSQESAR